MESKLKQTISSATENDTLHSIDWDNYPLPQQMIRYERSNAAHRWQHASVSMALDGSTSVTPDPTSSETKSKKRKSQDSFEANDENPASTAPWRITNSRIGIEHRITKQLPAKERFEKRQQPQLDEALSNGSSKLQKITDKRQKKFDGGYKSTYKSPSPDPSSGPVVGTCQTLEKKYFRLTSAPVPSQVRPEYILRQTLDMLKAKWNKERNYSYACDQLKSLRQDLTVQRIKNEFTVDVYETHAKIALEKGDLGEYNQCQTQLHALYPQNPGKSPVEFKAYRVLYFIHTSNRSALNDVLADLTLAEKEEPAIKHALSVRSAVALGNYHRFFKLYDETPNRGEFLMNLFVPRERLAAISNICKSYVLPLTYTTLLLIATSFKPDVKLRYITEELGFNNDADAYNFITEHNGQHLLEGSEDDLRFLSGKAGSLFEVARGEAFRKVDIKGQI